MQGFFFRSVWVTVLLASVLTDSSGQSRVALPVYPDSAFTTYYHQRKGLFESMPSRRDDVVFIGNSITDGGEWGEIFGDTRVKNRGISGDHTAGLLHRTAAMAKGKPDKVFLLIGINDLARGLSTDSVERNILLFASYLRQESPTTRLFVQSLLPVSNAFGKFGGHTAKADSIVRLNRRLREKAASHGYTYLDLHNSFIDAAGRMDGRYTNDGLHLTGEGYLLWKHLVFPHVHDLQPKPSLLPLPVGLKWTGGRFPLHKARSVVASSDALVRERDMLLGHLTEMGWKPEARNVVSGKDPYIELRLDASANAAGTEEGYELSVTSDRVLVRARTPHGVFNGIQTLRQLMRDGLFVDACEIVDAPAFPWRGYMIDVGRNHMSVDLLKRQIDIMAMHKLNVFHFHATEDIAWRIASERFPQLNAPEHMLRDKGQYYTEAEIRSLIAYCRDRHILFLPEIDMPGHSAAFRRAMKTDMQSDTGMAVVKEILREFCRKYDVPYIHIGSDEVRIDNPRFLPEMVALLDSMGRQVVGWEPGGNLGTRTIRQVWREDAKKSFLPAGMRFLDSRHLYLNHMDPLESVVTIFNRRIADRDKGDSLALGAILCMWHDRAAGRAEDILAMNPVYPGMMSFAERSWRGGGRRGWISNIVDGDAEAFAEFENRLIDNRKMFLPSETFPYHRQSDVEWRLFGPYPNGGDPTRSFGIQDSIWKGATPKPAKTVKGGTVVMRHWWTPLVKGVVDEPRENETWYAATKIWSEVDETREAWIGFENLSRSYSSSSPPKGAWDHKGAAVWVNGASIPAPDWIRAGQKGHPEIPLVDEGYEYRAPERVTLRKGWNTVLVRVPVASFKARGPQDPVKWMFSFLLLPRKG